MQTWAQVLTRTRGGCVVHRYQNKDPRTRGCDFGMWMTSCTGSARGGFWGFWRKSVSWVRLRTGRVDFRGSLRPDECVRYGRRTWWGWADGKVIIQRLCISLPYVETFNSKVINVFFFFLPELRSRYVFFVFWDSYVLCIYAMNILWTFHTYPYLVMLQCYIKAVEDTKVSIHEMSFEKRPTDP